MFFQKISGCKEIVTQLEKIKYEKIILNEKHKQMTAVIEMNGGEIPFNDYRNFTHDEYIREDRNEVN